jgi:hypothetical protein
VDGDAPRPTGRHQGGAGAASATRSGAVQDGEGVGPNGERNEDAGRRRTEAYAAYVEAADDR